MSEFSPYIRRLLKKIADLQLSVCKGPAAERVHALRVAIKQFNAMLSLIYYCTGEKDKRQFGKLRNVFRSAGKMREWQLLQEKLKGSPLFAGLKHHLKKEEQRALRHFLTQCRHTDRSYFKNAGKDLAGICSQIKPEEIENYFNDLKVKIETAWNQQNRNVKVLHQIRMMLKEFRYNIQALKTISDASVHIEPDLKQLNDFDRLLGDWHDLEVMAHQFSELARQAGLTQSAISLLVEQQEAASSEASAILLQLSDDMGQLKL